MKKFLLVTITVFISTLLTYELAGQAEQDTVQVAPKIEKVKKGSIFSGRPGKSMLMSLVIPGAGQIYNKSYLRVPFVWGAVGGMGYLLNYNTRQYNCYRDKYISLIDNTPYVAPAKCPPSDRNRIDHTTDPGSIRFYRDQSNVNRQWAIIGFTLVWLANGVDAFVDAHLKDFDIDDDLSIDIGPMMDNDPNAPMRMGVFVQF